MLPKVSVIIPFHNASNCIAKCCESLFSQTLSEMQFVFVDDGSTDDSLSIVKNVLTRYPSRLTQTLLFEYPQKSGVGAARQFGLEHSTGEYIIHCDSDDWVEPNMYEILYNQAIRTSSEIVTCGYSVDTINGRQTSLVSALCVVDSIEFSISPKTGSLWNKLISRSFIETNCLSIPTTISWGEDLCFSLKALLLANRITSCNEILYHYVQWDTSLTHGISLNHCKDLIKCGVEIEHFVEQKGLIVMYQSQLNWLKFQLKQYLIIFPATRSIPLWKATFQESNKDIHKYPCQKYLKLIAWLLQHHLDPIASFLLRIKDILSSFRYS